MLFAERIPEEGLLIISSNIENYEEITAGLPCRVQMVGTRAEDDYRMDHITYNASGKPEFDCYVKGSDAPEHMVLNVPGRA